MADSREKATTSDPARTLADDGGGAGLPLSTPLVALPPRFAKLILVAVLAGFYGVALVRIAYSQPDLVTIGTSALWAAAIALLHWIFFTRPPTQLRARTRNLALALQAAFVYIPLVFQFHQEWIGMPGFLAGSLLLTLPARFAWPAFAAVVASAAVAQARFTGAPLDITYTTVSTILTGLVVYGLTRLATVVGELQDARETLTTLAVSHERLRVARDLHDVLGSSLSAITLKSELTQRLIATDPKRAAEELSDVTAISRRTLSDVKSVAKGYRDLALDDEVEAARSLLLAAGVAVDVEFDSRGVPDHVRPVLAVVIREGITNVLRHSTAEICEIRLELAASEVLLEIVNDGVPTPLLDSGPNRGAGIANLGARLGALGGAIHARLDPDGRYRLRASVPIAGGTADRPQLGDRRMSGPDAHVAPSGRRTVARVLDSLRDRGGP